jgi:ribonucleoside-triphosphate reductase
MQDEGNQKRTRCEVYSRVVGFLSPLSQWNRGKKEEYRDRVTFHKGLKGE